MARKRTRNYRELREENDAAEARAAEDEDEDEDEDVDEDEDEDEDEELDLDEEEEEEEAPKPKPKKKKAAAKTTKPRKPRASKANVRKRVVWGVFSNSNQCVATFPYPKKQEAEDHAEKLKTDKNQTFFIQPVKEDIVEEPA